MSRSDARSRRLRRRPSRVVPATVVAVVLLALGAVTAVAAITRLANGTWSTQVTGAASAVSALTWGSAPVITAAAVTALVGLVLLVAGIKLGPFRTAQLDRGGPSEAVADTDFVISTRALSRLAAACADQVDGVDDVSASASGRRVQVRVTTHSEQADQIRQEIHQGVTEVLSRTGVQPLPRVTATVRTKEI